MRITHHSARSQRLALPRVVGEALGGPAVVYKDDAPRPVRRESALLAAAATDVLFETPEPTLDEAHTLPSRTPLWGMLAWISSTLGRMICSANEACSVMCCLLLVPPLAPEEAVLGRRPALLLLGALVAQVLLDHAPARADVFPTVVRHPEPPWPSHGISLTAPKSRPLRCSFRLFFHQLRRLLLVVRYQTLEDGPVTLGLALVALAPRRPVLFSPSRGVASHRPCVARLENPGSFSLAGEDLLDELGAEDHDLPRSWRIHPRTVSRNPSRSSRW